MSDDQQSNASHKFFNKNNTGERRGRPLSSSDSRMSRKRRRYLVVPQTERDLSLLQSAYCDANDGHWRYWSRENNGEYKVSDMKHVSTVDTSASSSLRRNCRPLPSTQILILTTNETSGTRDTTHTRTRSAVTTTSLLLRNFYESIGMKDHLDVASGSAHTGGLEGFDTDNKEREQEATSEIDDPSLSTLKIGHHRRYLKLTTTDSKHQQTSKLTFAQRKELDKLRQMISKEQSLYRSALDKFHDSYKSRYLIGFQSNPSNESAKDGKSGIASLFCRWACFHAQSINREWGKAIASREDSTDSKARDGENISVNASKNNADKVSLLPKYYGKVRQTLALHYRTHQSTLDVHDLVCSVVHESAPIVQSSSLSSSSSLPAKLPEVSTKDIEDGSISQKISPPMMDSAPPVRLLRNDPKVLELASKYSATIVTTSETLETLLRFPGHHSSKWMLPCTTRTVGLPNTGSASKPSSSRSVTILDLPIAQAFSSPRSCIEMALQEGIYQDFIKQCEPSHGVETSVGTQNDREKQDGSSPLVSQVVYSLWVLPAKNVGGTNGSRKKMIRILIRTLVRLRDSVSKLPVRIRARIEYFSAPVSPESRSRREIPNSYEKSLWILDQVLFGHQVFGLQYRIDPTTCEIVGWDTTSVAHAFAASETDGIQSDSKFHHSNLGPSDHWKALIQLLQSIPSISMPDTLLCLPGLISERKTNINDASRENLSGDGKISTVPLNSQQEQVRLDPFSVSVHGSFEDINMIHSKQSATSQISFPPPSTGNISLDRNVLDRAGSVILGDQALQDCRREWEWDRTGQVPNTFPVIVDTAE